MSTPRTFEDAVRDRDEGIRRAAEAAGTVVGDDGRAGIGDTVYDAIVVYLACHDVFHVDDFWCWAGRHHPGWRALGLDPGRYIGAQMQKVIRRKMMSKIPVDGFPGSWAARPSIRSNLAPKWIYRSEVSS